MRRTVLALLCTLCLLCSTLAGCGASGPESELFPIWEKNAWEYPAHAELQMDFRELRFGCRSSDLEWDELTVNVKNSAHFRGFRVGGAPFHIDYLKDGKWYIIYRPKYGATGGSELWQPENNPVYIRLPAGLCAAAGTYRITMALVGTCEFTVDEPAPGPADGADLNDFPLWLTPDKERTVREEYQLTFDGLELNTGSRETMGDAYLYDADYDYVCFTVTKTEGDEPMTGLPKTYTLMYLSGGEWYTVSAREPEIPFLTELESPQQKMPIPRGVLSHPGTYRLWWEETGYFDFEVSPAEAAQASPLPLSERPWSDPDYVSKYTIRGPGRQ